MLGIWESRNVEERFVVGVGSLVSDRSRVYNNIITGDAIYRVLEVNIIGKVGQAIH